MGDAQCAAVFAVDELYSSAEIQAALCVGNAGGVRLSLNGTGGVRRLVVMTSVADTRLAKENPYHDRIEDNVLVYTGAGLEGDQSLSGVNARIPQQLASSFPIYGFAIIASRRDKGVGPKRWRFLGLLEYLRHYPETQVDTRGDIRRAWVFEMRVHREPPLVPVLNDAAIAAAMLAEAREADSDSAEDREIGTTSATPSAGGATAAADAAEVETLRSRLLGIPPQRFEQLVRDVLVFTGFERVTVTKYSQDGGIDVNAYAGPQMWPLKDLLVQVQAKRWLHSVGRKEIAELRGSLQPFARGSVVTTSHFTKAAMREAAEPGKNPIVLVDGYTLAGIVRCADLGVE